MSLCAAPGLVLGVLLAPVSTFALCLRAYCLARNLEIEADPYPADRMGGSPVAVHRLPGHRLAHGDGARRHPHLCPRDPAPGDGTGVAVPVAVVRDLRKDTSHGVAPPRLVG